MRREGILWAVALVGMSLGAGAQAPPAKLVAKYAMPPSAQGRFDHVRVDRAGNRLLLAGESAHKVFIFNLTTGRYERSIGGIGIPHATFVRDDLHRIYVTDGGAGELRVYDSRSYKLLTTIPLKVDADSIAYDPASTDLYIDSGGGDAHQSFSMFSTINTTTDRKVNDMDINGDTLEAIALEDGSARIFINNRALNRIAVVDRNTHKLLTSWPVTRAKVNVAMALDQADHLLFIGCRSGAIVVMDTRTGKELEALPIPTGIDDLIYDAASHRLYAACGDGAGALSVYQQVSPRQYKLLGNLPTGPMAKNIALSNSLHRLYLAVPPQGAAPGAIWVYQVP